MRREELMSPQDELKISEDIIKLDGQIKASALEVRRLLTEARHEDSTLLLFRQMEINASLLAVISLRLERLIGRSTTPPV